MSHDQEDIPSDEEIDPTLCQIFAMAGERGWVGVEFSPSCPVCGQPSYHFHNGTEILNCMIPGCKGRWPTKIPRPPQPGDETAEQYEQVIANLHDKYVEALKELDKPVQAEVEALPEGIRLLVARNRLASQIDALRKVVAVVSHLAELAKRGHR